MNVRKNNKSLGILGKTIDLNERETITNTTFQDDGGQSSRTTSKVELLGELSRERILRKNKFDIKKDTPIDPESEYVFSIKSKSPKRSGERKGFFSKASRFPTIQPLESSPVCYDTKKLKDSLDFNVKGFGNGFLSKNERFQHLPYLNTGPGPGQYVPLWHINSPIGYHKREPNVYHAFLPPKFPKSPKIRPLVQKELSPGPGKYNPNEKLIKKSIPTYKSIFKSTSPRELNMSCKRNL